MNDGNGDTSVRVEEGGEVCVAIGGAVAGKATVSELSVWGGKLPKTSQAATTATKQLRDINTKMMVTHCLGEILLILTPGDLALISLCTRLRYAPSPGYSAG